MGNVSLSSITNVDTYTSAFSSITNVDTYTSGCGLFPRERKKIILQQATKKYKKEIFVYAGEPVPFNETPAWDADNDHWFELPLFELDAPARLGEKITGRLFSTRMPRGITPAWRDGTEVAAGMTDPAKFKAKVQENGLTDVCVLVESQEPGEYGSSDLFEFYREYCGLQVTHAPIKDYSLPTVKAEEQNINDIVMKLVDGKGVIVHCLGGSGRTGTVVIGVLKELGCRTPIGAARRIKSVYLDIAEQEQFVESLSLTIRADMVKKHPRFANVLVCEHLEELCENPDRDVEGTGELSQDELLALRELFAGFDHDGSGMLSVGELHNAVQGLYRSGANKSKVTIESLERLVNKLEPGATEVNFALFLEIMHTTARLSESAHIAVAKSDVKT